MQKAAAIALVSVVAVAGLGLAFQGWRARGPDVDVIASMVRSVALAERAHIPRRGNLTDLNAFRPPGHVWLMAPAAAVFSDPRHVELASSALLYLATLCGVFVLGQRVFGGTVAAWATVLYAFSSIAINFAAVMQPKAYPLFTVWMVYCAVEWVRRRDARWLGASVVVWACGMYVHLEMAPYVLVYPLIWWRHRPPVRWPPFALALVFALVMWTPYLAFQQPRAFIDLRSQLFSKPLNVRGPIVSPYCGEEPVPATLTPMDARLGGWRERPAAIASLVMMNFETRVPGGPLILLALVAAGVISSLRARGEAGVIALALLAPGSVLVLLTEPGVPRSLGVWPFEILLIAAAATSVAGRIAGGAASRIVQAAAMTALLVIVAVNLQTLQRVRDWRVNGWSGLAPVQVEWADFRSVRCSDEPSGAR